MEEAQKTKETQAAKERKEEESKNGLKSFGPVKKEPETAEQQKNILGRGAAGSGSKKSGLEKKSMENNEEML